MTVRDLKAMLDQFNDDLRVVTPGFDESKLDDVGTVRLARVRFHDDATGGHTGRHEEANGYEHDKTGDIVDAVLINF
jgi:hypothetical protein